MDPIDVAIEVIESREPEEHFTYTEIADQFNVSRSTLSRRHRGVQRSNDTYYRNKQLLNPHEELELIQYINQLTEDGLAPTRTMVQNFAGEIAAKPASQSWVTRFMRRHSSEIASHWTTGLDRNHHKADS
ncbi:hypothetical protein EJ07DRAFT_58652, partial [Lizonia empirigonia]